MIWYFGASLILVLVFNSVYNLTPSFEYLSLRECTFVCHRLAVMRILGCLFNQNDHKICDITPPKISQTLTIFFLTYFGHSWLVQPWSQSPEDVIHYHSLEVFTKNHNWDLRCKAWKADWAIITVTITHEEVRKGGQVSSLSGCLVCPKSYVQSYCHPYIYVHNSIEITCQADCKHSSHRS